MLVKAGWQWCFCPFVTAEKIPERWDAAFFQDIVMNISLVKVYLSSSNHYLFEFLKLSAKNLNRVILVKKKKIQNGLDVEMSCPFRVSFNRFHRF